VSAASPAEYIFPAPHAISTRNSKSGSPIFIGVSDDLRGGFLFREKPLDSCGYALQQNQNSYSQYHALRVAFSSRKSHLAGSSREHMNSGSAQNQLENRVAPAAWQHKQARLRTGRFPSGSSRRDSHTSIILMDSRSSRQLATRLPFRWGPPGYGQTTVAPNASLGKDAALRRPARLRGARTFAE
jgi:hypothetical protein